MIVSVGPADPTSFDPPGPGFYESTDLGECEVIETGNSRQCLRPFAESLEACINPIGCLTPLAEETWTRVKARY